MKAKSVLSEKIKKCTSLCVNISIYKVNKKSFDDVQKTYISKE